MKEDSIFSSYAPVSTAKTTSFNDQTFRAATSMSNNTISPLRIHSRLNIDVTKSHNQKFFESNQTPEHKLDHDLPSVLSAKTEIKAYQNSSKFRHGTSKLPLECRFFNEEIDSIKIQRYLRQSKAHKKELTHNLLNQLDYHNQIEFDHFLFEETDSYLNKLNSKKTALTELNNPSVNQSDDFKHIDINSEDSFDSNITREGHNFDPKTQTLLEDLKVVTKKELDTAVYKEMQNN